MAAAAGLLLALAGVPPAAQAQTVSLQGSLGAGKALLLIDGQPQTLAVGATVRGVTLRSLAEGSAEVEVAGQRQWLRLGAAPARVGAQAQAAAGGASIVLPMGPGGHFVTAGSINGRPVQFMVDTGATSIALGQAQANSLGLDWKRGRPGLSHTANGTVPVYAINISSVKVGGVEVANVDAVVMPSDMPVVLLGNSFLNRFTMRRDADTMRLEKKP